MNNESVRIGLRSALPACGEVKEMYGGGRFLCVANVDGEICVMDNVCPHWGGPLGRGTIIKGQLVCPWHGWTFDPKTGATPNKAKTAVAVHKFSLDGEDVLVSFTDSGQTPAGAASVCAPE
jgi:nitrite reductase (NADH) small subunit